MANTIRFPNLNPFKFVLRDSSLAAGYHIRHLDDALQQDQIYNFQPEKFYLAKLQNTDTVYFQVIANYGPVVCSLLNCEGDTVVNGSVAAINTNFYTAPETAYGCSIDIASVAKGNYQVYLSVGSGAAKREFVSEPIAIDADHANTLLLAYTHRENKAGVIFENGETFYFRTEGVLTDFQPGSNDVVYEDQTANLVSITSFPFRSWKLVAGNSEGIPDWVADRINRIFGCDTVNVDGKQFTKPEGGKMERNGDREYPLAAWTFEIREAESQDTVDYSNTTEIPAAKIYYGVQTTPLDPEDFSQFITGNAYVDININYGATGARYFWMAHLIDAPTKTNWKDINDVLNAGRIGGTSDLFSTRVITIADQNYTCYMTRYATIFAGTENKLKFYIVAISVMPPSGLSALYSFAFQTISVTFTPPSPAGDSYTIRVTGVTSGASDYYTGVMSSPYIITLDAPAAENYNIAIRTEKDGNSSDWSADYLLEIF